jgi:glycosyltransferase involved in cell wall biosynthesis
MPQQRIVMLLENSPYPQDERVCNEANALTMFGHQVKVICPASPGQPFHEVIDGVSVYRYPSPPTVGEGLVGYVSEYAYSMVAMGIISLLLHVRGGFDVIHAHNPPDTLVVLAAGYKLLGKQFVYDQHDLSSELYYARLKGKGNRLVYQVLRFFEHLSCQVADQIIATNESYKARQIEQAQVPEERVTVVRNGPNLNRLPTLSLSADQSPHPGEKIVIGYIGVMNVQDGVDLLLHALAHLVYDKGRTDVFCLLIGSGGALDDLKQLTTQLGLEQHVWFSGWISESRRWKYFLSLTDICVSPDPSNSFNDRSTMIKIMEYMALAKPVVVFDLPEHRRTAGEAAAYAEPNDIYDFANHVAQLIEEPVRRHKMGQIGRRRVERELAWPHQAKKLLQVYDMLQPEQRQHQETEPNLLPKRGGQ